MLRVKDLHLCDYAFVANGKLSMVGIFANVSVVSVPTI